jgi:HK97 family phage portal protein
MRSPLGALLNRTPVPYASRATGRLSLPFLQPTGQEAQMRAMEQVGTVHAIVSRSAKALAGVEWHLYRKAASGRKEDRTEVTSHAALDVWNRPNPFHTREVFVEAGAQHKGLTGEQWWVIGRNPRSPLPLELWTVRPDRMQPVPHPTEFLSGYMYTGPDGQQIALRLEDVIFIRTPHPRDPYRGISPIQPLLTDIDADRYSKEWLRNYFINGAEPGGIIEVPNHLSDPEFNELRERWNEQHKGVANAHKVAILEHGQWKDRTVSQRDMQFVESSAASREVIREGMGFPKPMLGTVDDANRANMEAADVMFSRWTLVPDLRALRGALNHQLLPMFGKDTARALEFDFDDPTPADRELDAKELEGKARAAGLFIDAGFEPESVREALGLPEMAAAPQVGGDGTISPRELADMVQSIYLGVNTVLTWQEAREVCNRAGANLDLSVPAPDALAPAPAGPPPVPVPPPGPAARLDIHHHPAPAAALPPGRSVSVFDLAREHRTRRPALTAATDDSEGDDADLDQVREDHEAALADLLEAWQDIDDAWIDQLADQVEEAVDDGDTEALAALVVDGEEAAGVLRGALAAAAQQAAERMAAEARRQGVDVEAPQVDEELTAKVRLGQLLAFGDELAGIAAAVAAMLGGYMAAQAGQEALRRYTPGAAGRTIANAVRGALRGIKGVFRRDQLGGAVHRAQNVGRLATLEAAPRAAWRASEVNDRNRCQPCTDIDGTVFETLADAWVVYGTGGYAECEGGIRCRGTVTATWG